MRNAYPVLVLGGTGVFGSRICRRLARHDELKIFIGSRSIAKAMRLALPAYTNEVVFLFQATSLVSIITILDLTGVARVLIAKTFDVFEIWIFVAICYLILTYAMLYGFKALEHRLMGHLRDRETGEAPGSTGGPLEVKRAPNGPLLLSGNFEIVSAGGQVTWSGTKAALCRCGASKNKPFCDGAHKEAGFEG